MRGLCGPRVLGAISAVSFFQGAKFGVFHDIKTAERIRFSREDLRAAEVAREESRGWGLASLILFLTSTLAYDFKEAIEQNALKKSYKKGACFHYSWPCGENLFGHCVWPGWPETHWSTWSRR